MSEAVLQTHPLSHPLLQPLTSLCRQREEAERIAEEARKRQSDMVSLQTMFQTTVSSPGEQPLGVTLIDGYNLMHRVGRVGWHAVRNELQMG